MKRMVRLCTVLAVTAVVVSTTPSANASDESADFTVAEYVDGAYATPAGNALSRTASPTPINGLAILLDATTGREALADVSLLSSTRAAAYPAMVASTADFVDLSWTAVPGVSAYAVFRENVLLAQVEGVSYRDPDVEPGEHINYRIEAVLPSEDAQGRVWGLVAVVPDSSSADSTGLASDFAEIQTAAASYTTATIQHQTFIPQSKISAPPIGCTYNAPSQYGGDGRSFLASGSPYRTRVQAEVGFTGSGTVSSSGKIGATHAYDSLGNLIAQKTATGATLTATRLAASSGTSVDVRFNVNATNPFCTSFPNSISAVFTITVTKTGAWSIISGQHKQMPNHELYIHSNSGGWATAYQRSYASLACLVEFFCANANMTGHVGSY